MRGSLRAGALSLLVVLAPHVCARANEAPQAAAAGHVSNADLARAWQSFGATFELSEGEFRAAVDSRLDQDGTPVSEAASALFERHAASFSLRELPFGSGVEIRITYVAQDGTRNEIRDRRIVSDAACRTNDLSVIRREFSRRASIVSAELRRNLDERAIELAIDRKWAELEGDDVVEAAIRAEALKLKKDPGNSIWEKVKVSVNSATASAFGGEIITRAMQSPEVQSVFRQVAATAIEAQLAKSGAALDAFEAELSRCSRGFFDAASGGGAADAAMVALDLSTPDVFAVALRDYDLSIKGTVAGFVSENWRTIFKQVFSVIEDRIEKEIVKALEKKLREKAAASVLGKAGFLVKLIPVVRGAMAAAQAIEGSVFAMDVATGQVFVQLGELLADASIVAPPVRAELKAATSSEALRIQTEIGANFSTAFLAAVDQTITNLRALRAAYASAGGGTNLDSLPPIRLGRLVYLAGIYRPTAVVADFRSGRLNALLGFGDAQFLQFLVIAEQSGSLAAAEDWRLRSKGRLDRVARYGLVAKEASLGRMFVGRAFDVSSDSQFDALMDLSPLARSGIEKLSPDDWSLIAREIGGREIGRGTPGVGPVVDVISLAEGKTRTDLVRRIAFETDGAHLTAFLQANIGKLFLLGAQRGATIAAVIAVRPCNKFKSALSSGNDFADAYARNLIEGI